MLTRLNNFDENAVQEQLAAIDNPGVMNQWLQHEPGELIKNTETWVLGK
jgi:hypothetical protein